jgi:DNA-binding transcriptional ArsR family regulator
MSDLNELGRKCKALAHPLRLQIIRLLAMKGVDMYLSEIANALGVNRALAKIHLKRLQGAGIVKSYVVLVEGEARALRYYNLQDFDIHVSPEIIKQGGRI